ncbi:hypothetical protein ETAA8_60060 [Anatilimnocola aggregata]|uniref:Uncharacterized protein n=1 Tax=Anatilimnocola aggregata TaxID=2528021 RepID=A0A517YKU5_9BACT|nr:hypothetical protein [Anatilimnocola aggregata]QDU30857.1 hypothetical protein ETAA8_60060 [Anatilimnocola aggregata]
MIAQPTSIPASSGNQPEIQQELLVLQTRLDEAFARIQQLEARQPEQPPLRPPLFSLNSPVMDFARQLCEELFPGPLEIEVACAPDDPSAQWYVFLVSCKEDIQESIQRELKFGRRLVEAFPDEAGDIRLAVSPV